MAANIKPASLGQAEIQRRTTVPGDVLLSDHILKELEIDTNKVDPREILSYLAERYHRLQYLQFKLPSFKVQSADIPMPTMELFEGDDLDELAIASLEELTEQLPGELSTASGIDFEQLQGLIDALLEEYQAIDPTPPDDPVGPVASTDSDTSGDGSSDTTAPPMLGDADFGWDIIERAMTGEIIAESQEQEEEYRRILAQMIADPKVGASTLLLAIATIVTNSVGAALGKAVKNYQTQEEDHRRFIEQFDFGNGELSPTDMSQLQVGQQQRVAGSQMMMQTIQALRSNMDKVQVMVKSGITQETGLADIVRNIRT